MVFGTIEQAIEDIRAGRFVIVADDEDRENEGDLICAAQLVTPEMVNFMVISRPAWCPRSSKSRGAGVSSFRFPFRNSASKTSRHSFGSE